MGLDELVVGAHGLEADLGDPPHVSSLAEVVLGDEVVGQIARGVRAAPVLAGGVPLRAELVEIRLGVTTLAVGGEGFGALGEFAAGAGNFGDHLGLSTQSSASSSA